MRVLMLTDYFPPHVGGGVEKVVSELANGLVSRGHSVKVLTLQTCNAPARESSGRLTIERTPALDLTPRLGVQFAISAHVVPAIIRALRSFQPDLVHAHNLFFRTTELAALMTVRSSTPMVTTVHLGKMKGGPRVLSALTSAYEGTLGRLILRASTHITAVSSAAGQHARKLVGPRKPITVIKNGVDVDRFHPPVSKIPEPPRVLFVGRLVPNKGPGMLLKTAPLILRLHPETRIQFAGEGPLRDRLEAMARDLGIEHSVDFLGHRSDVPDLMRRASIFVRPSSLEGLPLTALEAMASGLPVVATDVGGTPEVVENGRTGFLVPVGDEEALARAIQELLDDSRTAATMGVRGRAMVESAFTWEHMVAATERVYERVLTPS